MASGKSASRSSRAWWLIAALVAAAPALAILRPAVRPPEVNAAGDAVRATAVVREGDVICRLGAGLWSRMFRERSQRERRFSHVGIVTREDGRWCVVHAAANDISGAGVVRSQPLADFLAESVEWSIFRHPAAGPTGVAGRARAYLGRPFDTAFDLADANRVYCSELVFRAFADAGIAGAVSVTEAEGRSFVGIDDCYLSPAMALVLERRAPAGAARASAAR